MTIGEFYRVISFLAREYDGDQTLAERIKDAKTYVDNRLFRADIVSPLPADAPAGYLMVTPGDINLYIGTGAGNPLRKIPTLPL